MWTHFKTFTKLSKDRKKLLIIVFFLSFYSMILFNFFKKRVKFGKFSCYNLQLHSESHHLLFEIAFAIKIIGKYSPWLNVCRHQAYQAKLLCQFYKIPYKIFVGFKKGENHDIEGHAWSVVNGHLITGFCNIEEYHVHTIYEG